MVGLRQCVHVAQHAQRPRVQFLPQETGDIERRLPAVRAIRAGEAQLHIGLRVGLRHRLGDLRQAAGIEKGSGTTGRETIGSITDAQVVKPGERGFLAAVLKPGERAVSVSVNATTGISGFVFPGDRVDVILTHAIQESDKGGNENDRVMRHAAETILTNIRVIAVDQTINDQTSEPAVAKNVTLEVTPKQAEMMAVAVELGRIQLSRRSLAKEDQTAIDPVAAAATGSGTAEGQPAAQMLAGGSGADPETATTPAADEKAAAAPLEEPEVPFRGHTYTFDSEVSRLLSVHGNEQKVQLVQGDKSQELVFQK